METYKKAVSIWGPGLVWCNFVGGISPIKDLKEGFRFMADMGVVLLVEAMGELHILALLLNHNFCFPTLLCFLLYFI